MRSRAAGQQAPTANRSHAAMHCATGSPPRRSSSLSKIPGSIGPLTRSFRSTYPKRQSSRGSSVDWPRSFGGFAGPLQSKPGCCGCKARISSPSGARARKPRRVERRAILAQLARWSRRRAGNPDRQPPRLCRGRTGCRSRSRDSRRPLARRERWTFAPMGRRLPKTKLTESLAGQESLATRGHAFVSRHLDPAQNEARRDREPARKSLSKYR
jgi:hypothetical protein